MHEHRYDYIVVGAGSAGCVLANRLSADPGNRVLLIEAGGRDNSIFIRMPTAFSHAMNIKRFNWGFVSQPEPGLDGRRLDCPRGKVLGGSSSINGMVYVRGHGRDFDEWEELGAAGWNYRNCLPYFRRSESWQGGADAYRGDAGPIGTSGGNDLKLNPLYAAFIEAGVQAGYPRTDDYNGYRQEGFGPMQMTVRDGERASTARAYLAPAMKRPNLTVITNATVERVLLEGGSATGVAFRRSNAAAEAFAGKEVILAAGAIGSPGLLQLSGIGPADVLANAGVSLQHDLPGVGDNLQDHLEVYCQYQCLEPITLNGKLNPLGKALIGLRWLLFRDGLGSTNHFESCAFIRSRPTREWPDIQLHFLPAAMRYDGAQAFNGHGFQVHLGPNKPMSRGKVSIASADAAAKPDILFNYLQHEEDARVWRDAVRMVRKIMQQPALDRYRGEEIQPGAGVASDGEIDGWVRRNVESAYHPSCTCKMGDVDDPAAVVDSQCRVLGLERLRVVDSSIFPTITNGNLNAPTIMVAERAADMILGRPLLRPDDGLELYPEGGTNGEVASAMRQQ